MSGVTALHPLKREHFDVVIVGAGISGIGAAHHLGENCPEKSYLILETKESFGGTWRQHTYPGIRSDSDMHTLSATTSGRGRSPRRLRTGRRY